MNKFTVLTAMCAVTLGMTGCGDDAAPAKPAADPTAAPAVKVSEPAAADPKSDTPPAVAPTAINEDDAKAAAVVFSALVHAEEKLQLLPSIASPGKNPHQAKAFDGVKINDQTVTGTNYDESLVATMAYFHPQSPYKGKSEYKARGLFLMGKTLDEWTQGVGLAGEVLMLKHFQINYSYLTFKRLEPNAIPAGKKAAWEEAIRKNIENILNQKKDIYEKHIVGSVWLNGDIRMALGGYLGSLALGDETTAKVFRSAIEDCMTQTLLADGGTHYVGYQNESPCYHGDSSIRPFIWFYLFTGSEKVKAFIARTKNYIPLVFTPRGSGFMEWSTSPAWKPQYNKISPKVEALAKAYLTGDPFNYAIGKDSQYLYLAFLYRPGLREAELPDNFMLYDRNCMGPRGRFGTWGVVATLRDVSSPKPELTETTFLNMDGINSFVGAYILNPDSQPAGYPLNAAFQGTAPMVRTSVGEETDWNRGTKWAFLTGKVMHNAMTKTRLVYGLTTDYQISKKEFLATPWTARQAWIVTPDRVIGLTSMRNEKDTKSIDIAQRIGLVSGRKGATGTKKTLANKEGNLWQYGALNIKIHSSTYKGKPVFYEHGTVNDPADDFSTMLVLHDSNNPSTSTPIIYPAGSERTALLEVTDNNHPLATQSAQLDLPATFLGFEFTDETRKVAIIQNVSSSSVEYSGTWQTPFAKTRLVKSWDETDQPPLLASNGIFSFPSITIPPFAHILLLSSNIPADFQPGHDTYESVFKTP